MNWGTRIVIAFVLFAGVIASMVVVSMNQEVDLVAKDYYKQEINYQDQMDRITNYNELDAKPEIKVDRKNDQLIFTFPSDVQRSFKEGTIQLFRPSTTKVDQLHNIQLDANGRQFVDASELLNGRWQLRINWEDQNNKEYYKQTDINI